MQNQINLTPLAQYAQLVRAAQLNQSKEIKIPIQQAILLGLTLVELQDKVLKDYESMFNELKRSSSTEVVSVSMDGGGFEDSK